MLSPAEFSFRMQRTNWKSQDLIYDEADHRLIVYLEISGVSKFDWVGTDVGFEKWTVPDGEVISEIKREQILDRLADWAKANKVRIHIGPAISMEEEFAD